MLQRKHRKRNRFWRSDLLALFWPCRMCKCHKGYSFWGTGSDGQTGTNTMNQFTIQTTANATDFADLVNALQYASGASGAAS